MAKAQPGELQTLDEYLNLTGIAPVRVMSRQMALSEKLGQVGLQLPMLRAVAINGWFPSMNSRGEIVSGAGEIFVGSKSFGVGTLPKWMNDDWFVFNDANQSKVVNYRTGKVITVSEAYNNYSGGTDKFSGIVQAGPITVRLHDLAGGVLHQMTGHGNMWLSPTTGRYAYLTNFHDNSHRVMLNDGAGERELPSQGNAMSLWRTDRATIVTLATSTYGRKVMVYHDDQPTTPIDSSIQIWEDAYGCDGPDGYPWVLSVLQEGLMFRRAGAKRGHYLPGEWFNPTVRLVSGQFVIAASTGRGELLTKAINPNELGIDLTTIPDPFNKPPVCDRKYPSNDRVGDCSQCGQAKKEHGNIAEFPNLLRDVEAERTKFPQEKITHSQVAILLNNVAWKHHPDVGLLRKEGGNHTEQPKTAIPISVDWLIHRPSGKGGDFLVDAPGLGDSGERMPGQAKPSQPTGEAADMSRFVVAVNPGDEPPRTHRYIGGGNDTGICDDCEKPKADPVHEVPEGKVPHQPWLGEDGIGDCDLCMKPVTHSIHIVLQQHISEGGGLFCSRCGKPASDPIHIQPTGDLEARVVGLEGKAAELDDRLKAVEAKLGMTLQTPSRAKRPSRRT